MSTSCVTSSPPSHPQDATVDDSFSLSELRHRLTESHYDIMAEYEEKDALYATLELEQSLPEELSRHLTTMRMKYLDYQVQHGQMLEYENRTPDYPSSEYPSSMASNTSDELLRRIDEHQYHHQIGLIAHQHDQLARLHGVMAILNKKASRPGLSSRHQHLAQGHRHIQITCLEIMVLLEEQFDIDPDDPEMLDSFETTPDERDTPDTSGVL